MQWSYRSDCAIPTYLPRFTCHCDNSTFQSVCLLRTVPDQAKIHNSHTFTQSVCVHCWQTKQKVILNKVVFLFFFNSVSFFLSRKHWEPFFFWTARNQVSKNNTNLIAKILLIGKELNTAHLLAQQHIRDNYCCDLRIIDDMESCKRPKVICSLLNENISKA